VVSIGVGSGGFCGRDGVGIGGQRTIIGVRIGASRGGAQWGVLWRWWAGRPASPQTVERTRWSWRRFWTAPTPIRAKWGCELPLRRAAGMRGASKARSGDVRGATKARSADAVCHQGSYRGRGCPESPHRAWWSSRRRWRCRPARPPTHRDPTLRAAPPRSFPTPMIPQKPPIPTPINVR
jgi:hypothetical protein